MVIRELLVKLGFKVDTGKVEQFDRSVGALKEKLGGLATGATVAGAALAGIAYGFKRAFLDTAAEFERFQTILETTEGSSEGAQRAMDWVSDFAAKTPYELAQVTDAFVKLRAYGMNPTNGLLATLGGTSAAMGKDLMSAVEAMADAVNGESERLKEFGIKAKSAGGMITYQYTDRAGAQRTAKAKADSRDQIQATLQAIWNEKYGGAMDKLSRTWGGMVSNLQDQWTRFAKMVMDSGAFQLLRDELGALLLKLDRMAKSGELREKAEQFGRVLVKLIRLFLDLGKRALEFGGWLARAFERTQPLIDRLGGLETVLKGILAVIALIKAAQLGIALADVTSTATKLLPGLKIAPAALGSWALLGAAVLGVGAALDDLHGYTSSGKSSVTGAFLDGWSEDQPKLNAVRMALATILDQLGLLRKKQRVQYGFDEPSKFKTLFGGYLKSMLDWKMILVLPLAPALVTIQAIRAAWGTWGDDIKALGVRIGEFFTGLFDKILGLVDRVVGKVKEAVSVLPSSGAVVSGAVDAGKAGAGALASSMFPAVGAYRAYQAATSAVSVQGGNIVINAQTGASADEIARKVKDAQDQSLAGAFRSALLNFAGGEE